MKSGIVDEPPSLEALMAAVRHPAAGAIATFVGVVRDHNEGQSVDLLEYDCYRSMAEKEMASILDELGAEIPGVRLACQHRVGRLAIGDVAVACAASAAHRAEAFDACRALIDRIKKRVPIWKREHCPQGARWIGWQDARPLAVRETKE